jgi:hypothetical protein
MMKQKTLQQHFMQFHNYETDDLSSTSTAANFICLPLQRVFAANFIYIPTIDTRVASPAKLQDTLAMWRACNLTSFSPCLTGPVDYPFASYHKGPRFKSPEGTYVKPGFSC